MPQSSLTPVRPISSLRSLTISSRLAWLSLKRRAFGGDVAVVEGEELDAELLEELEGHLDPGLRAGHPFGVVVPGADRGLKVIIAGAGGAAHLPGMAASMTHLPVFGIPVESKALSGMDSLLSIVQMPGGIPVGTLAIGKAGAINAALLAASVLALSDPALTERLKAWRARQTDAVALEPVDDVPNAH